jgi:hypothetical protein
MGTFSSSNSTKHHGKRFSNHTLMFIYQELKINKRVNKDKHHTSTKFKGLFLFDFLWRNTKLRHFKLAKILKHTLDKRLLNSKTLSKTKPNQSKLEAQKLKG